jgi:flagellar motor protein MotB
MARVPIRPLRRKDDFEGLWLITFADLMVQLMAFFAVIYSFSAQDQQKLQDVLKSFQHELGVKGEGILPGGLGLEPAKAVDLEKQLSDLQAVPGGDLGVRMRLVSFRGAVLFPEGSPGVPETFQPLLTRVGELFAEYPGFTLICEGHAAPGEKGPKGMDALALSGQRSEAVLRTLVSQGVDPAWIAAEAHGDSQVDGNPGSTEGRALQRRVKFRFQRVAER